MAHITSSLERYGAKTFGSLERQTDRLQRFVEAQNNQFARELQQESELEQGIRERIVRKTNDSLKVTIYDHEYGLRLLCQAIENGHVTTKRG